MDLFLKNDKNTNLMIKNSSLYKFEFNVILLFSFYSNKMTCSSSDQASDWSFHGSFIFSYFFCFSYYALHVLACLVFLFQHFFFIQIK